MGSGQVALEELIAEKEKELEKVNWLSLPENVESWPSVGSGTFSPILIRDLHKLRRGKICNALSSS